MLFLSLKKDFSMIATKFIEKLCALKSRKFDVSVYCALIEFYVEVWQGSNKIARGLLMYNMIVVSSPLSLRDVHGTAFSFVGPSVCQIVTRIRD